MASAAPALAALRAAAAAGDPYGMVLTDFEMPDGDGETLARAVRIDPAFRGVPMVLLTSWISRTAPNTSGRPASPRVSSSRSARRSSWMRC